MSISISTTMLTAVVIVVLVLFINFGCTKTNPESPVKPVEELSTVKCDDAHNAVVPNSTKPSPDLLPYKLGGPVSSFYIETGSINFETIEKPTDDAKKAIQVAIPPNTKDSESASQEMKIFHMAYDENKTKYLIELERPANSGNIVIVAIGWEYEKNGKIELKPVWAGSIRIK